MIGEYVKLPNGDYGFVAEERGDMLLVLGDWDVALPCAVKACFVTPADDDAWIVPIGDIKTTATKDIAHRSASVRKHGRDVLKLVHLVENAKVTELGQHNLVRIHNALTNAGIGVDHNDRSLSLTERVELLAAKATANEVRNEHAQADLNAEGSALDKALAEVEELRAMLERVKADRDVEVNGLHAELTRVTTARDTTYRGFLINYCRTIGLMRLLRSEAPLSRNECEALAMSIHENKGESVAELASFLNNIELERANILKLHCNRIYKLEHDAQAMKTSLDLYERCERDIRALVLKHTFLANADHSHAHLVEQAFEVMDSRLDSLRDIMNGKLDNANAECERLREQVKSGRDDADAMPIVECENPTTKVFTSEYLKSDEIGLPGGWGTAKVLSNKIVDQGRWSTHYELVFRLPGQDESFAWRAMYSVGSTESQEERAWEYVDEVTCTLVRRGKKTVDAWFPTIAEEPACAHPTEPAPAPHENEQNGDESPESSKAATADDDENEFTAHVDITSGAHKGQRAHVRTAAKGNKLRVRLDESGKEDLVMRSDVRVLDGVLPEPVASTPRTKREPVVPTSEELAAVMVAVQSKPGLRSDIATRAGVSEEVATAALDMLFTSGKVIKPDARGKGAVWKPAPVVSNPDQTNLF
jgi:hypothetical protein